VDAAVSQYTVMGSNGAITTGGATQRLAVNAIGTAVATGQFGNATGATATTRLTLYVQAVVRTSATSGNILLQANASANNGVVVRAGAFFRAQKLA
jgi:hypothetical protein